MYLSSRESPIIPTNLFHVHVSFYLFIYRLIGLLIICVYVFIYLYYLFIQRIASEVCLIDKDASKAEAEAEDIRHAGVFLGNPLVTGTAGDSISLDPGLLIIIP